MTLTSIARGLSTAIASLVCWFRVCGLAVLLVESTKPGLVGSEGHSILVGQQAAGGKGRVERVGRRSSQDDEAFGSGDDAYFGAYSQIHHQIMMLQDSRRMEAYHSAIMQNKEAFQGKVVLDVGCGTGILSIWAAQAGARRVHAVEARSV